MTREMIPYLMIGFFSVFVSSVSQTMLKKASMKEHNSFIQEYLNLPVILAYGMFFGSTLLTMLGVCGVRIAWIQGVFPQSRTFKTIMTAYPISLSTTALLVLIVLLYYHPSWRIESARA